MVEAVHYTAEQYAPGVKNELATEVLFQRLIGRRYRIMGFDDHGHIELHPTRRDLVWVKPQDVKIVPRKRN